MTLFTAGYSVDLDVFQGPLDLLLYLIRKDEIDIYDIPVARITEQYLRYVEMLKLLNLENAGDYILMAATLIRIKAQMLLPRDPLDDDELDPREELTLALLEYKKFKEAGDILSERREIEARLTSVAGRTNGYKGAKTVLVQDTSLFDLLTAFHAVMARITDDTEYLVDHQGLTVEDRIAVLQQFFAASEYATFEQLFADIRSKIVAILTFLAVLEMTRMHMLVVRQAMPFSEIRIYRTDRAPVADSALAPDAEPPTLMEEVAADS